MPDIGYYTLPVIASFDGIDAQVNKTLGSKFGVAGKKAGKDFSKGAGEGLKSLEADVKRAGDAYGKMKDKAEDSLGKVRVAEAALTKARSSGDSARIVAAEERLNTARRNSTRATKDAGDAHRIFAAAQRSLGSGTDDLGGKFGNLSNLAGSAGKALGAAGIIAGGAALAGVAALGAGVLLVGNRLYELGAQFDDTFDNIRIKTGATGPQLEALQQATERLSTKVPLSIGEIGNVVAETSRALHLTGPDLDNVAGSIANLGRITGENVDVRALGKAFRGFGVDAKDQVPALDSLLRASQTTGVGVNELLATVVKGGAGLRQFGFGFGESAALATQFEEAGLDADKAMTGLTKGLAGLAKDGQTGQDALRGTVDQIKNLISTGDDAGALDLTNKLFGAKGGVQFFEAIKNGALDLDALSGSLNNTGDTIAAAAADTDDWSERWQTFKNTVAVALEPVATTVFDSVNEQLGNLATWVEGHQDDIVNFFVGVGQAAITGVDIALDAIGQLAQGVGQFIEPFGDIQGAMLDFQAFQATIRGDHDTARELSAQAQEAYGWGEGLDAAGAAMRNFDPSQLRDKLSQIGDQAKTSSDKIGGIGAALGALPSDKTVTVDADTGPAEAKMQAWFDKWKAVIAAPPTPTPAPPVIPSLTDPNRPQLGGHRASGGPIFGGVAGKDSVPIMAMPGEHMWTTREVNAVGGQGPMYRLRAMARMGMLQGFETGGEVTSDWYAQVAGSPYRMGGFGGMFDCSGAVSGGVNVAMGRKWNQGPPGGSPRMATGSEGQWLASQGFVMGVGPPGSIRVGWVNGGPGGGHTAMTLADGTNFESSSGKGVALGGNARGATDPMFTQHAYLPPGPQIPGTKGAPGSTAAPTSTGGGSAPAKSGGGGGGSNSLADTIGGAVKIGVDGLMETLGADGSFLPENFGIPKTLMAALGLKIKTPAGSFSLSEGFTPATDGVGGTSGSPFGMAMPDLPAPGVPPGGGATGPVDQSTNININSPQGDPQDIENRTRRAIRQTPRLDTHVPVGA